MSHREAWEAAGRVRWGLVCQGEARVVVGCVVLHWVRTGEGEKEGSIMQWSRGGTKG